MAEISEVLSLLHLGYRHKTLRISAANYIYTCMTYGAALLTKYNNALFCRYYLHNVHFFLREDRNEAAACQ